MMTLMSSGLPTRACLKFSGFERQEIQAHNADGVLAVHL